LNEARKQTGKKEKGLGKGIFASLSVRRRRTMGWERFRNSSVRGRQNRIIFFSLIEKNFGGARLKKCLENFPVLLAVAKRKRMEAQGGIYSKSACGF